jgi:hypothetical protein
VAPAVGSGASNAEVATALFLSEATVKAHVSRLLDRLDVANRVQIAIWSMTPTSHDPHRATAVWRRWGLQPFRHVRTRQRVSVITREPTPEGVPGRTTIGLG